MTPNHRASEFGSFLPVLIKLCQMTYGPILELGSGYSSTPFLHWCAFATKRTLVTYESDPEWFDWSKRFQAPFHDVRFVTDWNAIDISCPWSIALVDHKPEKRRNYEIKRLLHADYVVIHDSEPERDSQYRYHRTRGLFKYHYDYTEAVPNTSVWSRTYDFANFRVHDPINPIPEPLKIVSKEAMHDTQPGARRKYMICRAAREMYVATDDPEVKAKLRYICSLAEAITGKVKNYAPDWLNNLYPRREEFRALMADELDTPK